MEQTETADSHKAGDGIAGPMSSRFGRHQMIHEQWRMRCGTEGGKSPGALTLAAAELIDGFATQAAAP